MARIATVSPSELDEDVAQALHDTRMGIAALAGRETERMIEPLELYAHLPGLLRGVGALRHDDASVLFSVFTRSERRLLSEQIG